MSVPQSMRIQQFPDQLSPDSTIETSGTKRLLEKESFPTQLYRHIKVLWTNPGSGMWDVTK